MRLAGLFFCPIHGAIIQLSYIFVFNVFLFSQAVMTDPTPSQDYRRFVLADHIFQLGSSVYILVRASALLGVSGSQTPRP